MTEISFRTPFMIGCKCGRHSVGLNWNKGDELIGVGNVADVVMYDLTALSLLPRADPFTSILLSGGRPATGGSQIDRVFVRGKTVIRNGTSVDIDMDLLRKEILKEGPNYYPPVNTPTDFKSPFEVEYRAALGLSLAMDKTNTS